ncbi:MAG: PilZ domain-containing protein [Chromatiales bacterium]|jgi:hypothetical protein|nr:PilZ domain-containing protein [Chromatiales bacterium]
MESPEEKRTSDRLQLDNFQRVRDAESGNLIGYLGDISLVGLKVLGKQPIPIGKQFKLRVNYICMGGHKQSVELEVESIWEREEPNMPYQEIGYRFTSLSDDTKVSIERIMADLAERTT